VGLPPGLDGRQTAQVDTLCNTVGLALQRLRMEEELRAAQRAQAELAEGILTEGTRARSRIALHVHDEVLPFLAAAEIQSENVVTAAELGNPEMTVKLAHKVGGAVSDGIKTLREVIEDLRKQTIVPGDLVPFIREAADKVQLEHGIRLHVDVEDYTGGLAHPVEIVVTETVRNLLCNAVKHAQASEIRIRVASGRGVVTAEVRDAAAIANGHFFVDSAPGRGTRICLMMPTGTTPLPAAPSSRQQEGATAVATGAGRA
jgi:signal transduction histidine kinase